MPPETMLICEKQPESVDVLDRSAAPSSRILDLSIVIVNWNTRDVLRDCLHSIAQHAANVNAEIIVIDNGSRDGSAEMVEHLFPEVWLIRNERNRGFAAANNQGMRIGRGRYILLLNPDTVVLDDVLSAAVSWADDNPTVGIVGCQVMETSDAVQRTCFRFPSPLNTFLWMTGLSATFPTARFCGRAAYGPWSRCDARDVDVVSGMFMLVRREAIEQVGLMDEDYFVFAEEADWCHRFARHGWRRAFVPLGRILHVDGGSKSTEQVSVPMYVEMQKNLLIFHRKRLGRLAWLIARTLFALIMPMRSIWFSALAAISRSEAARKKAAQSIAAMNFHWTGRSPIS